ncbi:Mur ligase [Syncephalis plumigaleata]|nr:Mur ligase [Syncephalis plumigaleata]
MELGLERVSALLALFDQPQRSVPFIHVAGTNGKGSTSAFLASIYKQAGLQVGVFSSPHFLHPRDAIRINGAAISLDVWTYWRNKVDAMVARSLSEAPPTEFERETTIAWLIFRETAVDLAIIECGLGGRLDATNAGHSDGTSKLACVVTSIGLDHQRLLGDTTASIATEKAGIFLPYLPVILAEQSDTTAERTLVNIAHDMNCHLVRGITTATWQGSPTAANAQIVRTGNDTLHVHMGLVGNSQLVNVSTAISTVDTLKSLASSDSYHYNERIPDRLREKLHSITDDVIVKGVEITRWPWRLEWLSIPRHLWSSPGVTSRLLLLDGAHNPDAARLLRQYVDDQITTSSSSSSSSIQQVLWIVGLSKEKNVDGILAQLLRANDHLCAVPFTRPIAMPWVECQSPDDIVAVAQQQQQQHPTITAISMPSLKEALDYYNGRLNHQGSLIVVCGSLYLAADVYRLFNRTVDDLYRIDQAQVVTITNGHTFSYSFRCYLFACIYQLTCNQFFITRCILIPLVYNL